MALTAYLGEQDSVEALVQVGNRALVVVGYMAVVVAVVEGDALVSDRVPAAWAEVSEEAVA